MSKKRFDSYRLIHPELDNQPMYQKVIRAVMRFPEEVIDRAYEIFGVGVREERHGQDSGKDVSSHL